MGMLSIFQKKTYLADLIGGITDFHNHILPGIDDGAKTNTDSQEMMDEFRNLGIKQVVPTPHVITDIYPNTSEDIKRTFQELKSSTKDDFLLRASAEYMLDQHFLQLLKNEELLKLSGESILVEMYYLQQPINLYEILFSIQNHSYKPILAHPERYPYLHGKSLQRYEDLKNRGCKLQLNMLSLSGHYGDGVQRTAFRLIENGLIDYLCTDAHRLEHLQKLKMIKISKKHFEPVKKIIENNIKLFS